MVPLDAAAALAMGLSARRRNFRTPSVFNNLSLPPSSVSYDVHSANLAPALRLAPLAGELVGCWQHPSTGGS